ncbi:hypothetical protein AB1Y20_010416 [Prymnesium parvum]|uniref:PUB domain-containing protein n=1 Tax=Prymnesium parvum TaxID=97485 RepID=A0AB34INK3_PRYPA
MSAAPSPEAVRSLVPLTFELWERGGARAEPAASALRVYLDNILERPGQLRYRRIRESSDGFARRVLACPAAVELLARCGFAREHLGDGWYWVLRTVDEPLLLQLREELKHGLRASASLHSLKPPPAPAASGGPPPPAAASAPPPASAAAAASELQRQLRARAAVLAAAARRPPRGDESRRRAAAAAVLAVAYLGLAGGAFAERRLPPPLLPAAALDGLAPRVALLAALAALAAYLWSGMRFRDAEEVQPRQSLGSSAAAAARWCAHSAAAFFRSFVEWRGAASLLLCVLRGVVLIMLSLLLLTALEEEVCPGVLEADKQRARMLTSATAWPLAYARLELGLPLCGATPEKEPHPPPQTSPPLKTRLFNESDEERFLRIRNAYDALSGASREAKSKSI